MEEKKQKRWQSWPLWVALAALISFCAKELLGLEIGDTLNGLLDVLLPVLVAFGIVNNPTDSQKL